MHGGADADWQTKSDGGDQAAIIASRDVSRTVNSALERLPPVFREVLVMKEMHDFSYKQIAQVTETPIGTVTSRLARARKLLLAYLKQDAAGDQHGMQAIAGMDVGWPDASQHDTAPHVSSRQGFQMVRWSQNGMQFSAISDINVQDLVEFKRQIHDKVAQAAMQ